MTSPNYRALVVDDEVMVRQLIIRSLSNHGFICDGASNGLEAKTLTEEVEYDVVISDLRMPECHGHQLAVDLLAEKDPPVLVIHTGVVEPRLARDLMTRGVDDIVFKPVDYDILAVKVIALVDRRRSRQVKKADDLAGEAFSAGKLQESGARTPATWLASEVQHRETPPPTVGSKGEFHEHSQKLTPVSAAELKAKLAQVKQVLPISQSAIDLFEMTNSGEHDADQIANAIARDASLAVEVLRLSNSSFYNRSSEKITDLEDAVALLGQKRVGELAVATNALGALTTGVLPWMDVPLAWKRSLAAGIAIESLISAGGHRRLEGGLMICGIMHNLGRVVLGTLFPAKYEAMVQRCQHQDQTLRKVEESIFPTNHTDFLASLLSQWNIPPDICHPLKFLLEPYDTLDGLPESTRMKVRLIKTAVAISQIAVGRFETWDSIEFPSENLLTSLGIQDVGAIVKRTRDGLEEVLAGLPRDASNNATQQKTADDPEKMRQLAYFDLSGASFDFVHEVVASTDIELVEFPAGANEFEGGVLVNCLGVPPRELAARVPAAPNGKVLIVTDSTAAPQYSRFGQVLNLPLSYSALRSACWEASREGFVEKDTFGRCDVLA